jgi:single-strand DNA-binding protein
MNKAIIIGRLSRDPELKMTQNKVPVCSFTLAVDRRVKEGGNRVTDWIECVAWRKQAEFLAQYFRKGQRVLVVGQVQTRSWEKDGQKRSVTEILVDELEFVEAKAAPVATAAPTPEPAAEADGFLPFDL